MLAAKTRHLPRTRHAVMAAPRNDLPRLAGIVWKGWGAGALGDSEAQELAEAIESPAAKAATSRCCGSRPRSSESLERRRRWCASGKLPPQLAARFTQAERSVLAVIAAEAMKRGDCRLAIGHIAALAGGCDTSVNAKTPGGSRRRQGNGGRSHATDQRPNASGGAEKGGARKARQ
jgi:hypothetical protein